MPPSVAAGGFFASHEERKVFMELLDWKEFAKRLGVKEETFRRFRWRVYRHTFVGNGRNLRSARFAWHEDGSHLEWHGGPGVAKYKSGNLDADRRVTVGCQKEKRAKAYSATDIPPELDVFRSLRLPDGSIPLSPRTIT